MGITAHNEEANIGKLLQCVIDQDLQFVELVEILVVISGCTDNTEGIVRSFMARDGRIRLLIQAEREGKASAMNLFLRQAQEEVLIFSSADLQPAPDAIERLGAPFRDPEMGMTTSRPMPVNDKDTFMGFAAHLLWDLHHQMNLKGFKAGEMIAFRKVFKRIPQFTAVDEASVEPLIRGQGYKVSYVPEAIVYNKGPDTVADFLRQRRRIYAGHLELKQILGYSVSTMSGFGIISLLLHNLDWRPKQFIWTWIVVALEITGRLLGWYDFKRKKDHSVWDIASTTKDLKA
ncbi:MAG: glycosyltransferase [Candidatus Promineifilaceae bacterium]|nr:glycosyltransferase [Candidatus Promineifilaceae bacterium]